MEGRRLCLLWGVSLFCLARSQSSTATTTTLQPVLCPTLPTFNQNISTCPNITETYPAEEGQNHTCTCMENCRGFTTRCSDGGWTTDDNITSLCSAKKFSFTRGALNISFNKYDTSFQHFSCPPQHDLVGVNKSFCYNGNLADPAPTCEPRAAGCYKFPQEVHMKCHHEVDLLPAIPGTKTTCSCHFNCRNISLSCDADGKWADGDLTRLCAEEQYSYAIGPLEITYNKGKLDFSCLPTHDLSGGSRTSFCYHGNLTDLVPTCQPKASSLVLISAASAMVALLLLAGALGVFLRLRAVRHLTSQLPLGTAEVQPQLRFPETPRGVRPVTSRAPIQHGVSAYLDVLENEYVEIGEIAEHDDVGPPNCR